MLLAVDVGNTQIHLGAFDGDELAHDWRLATDRHATSDQIAIRVSGLLALEGLSFESLDGAIVSTVVPQLGPEYERFCDRHLGERGMMVGPQVKTGMPILVDNPHELGADRLVNAVAAHARVKGACVAVDFGTSTNFDVVSGAGEALGGVIGPGVEISLEALTARTAKLPRIDIADPRAAIMAGLSPRRSSRGSPSASPAWWTGSTAGSRASWARARASSRPAVWRRRSLPTARPSTKWTRC